MDKSIREILHDMGQKIIGYMPNLLGGLFLLLLGWVLGWLVKRIVIQLLVILRVDRLFVRLR
jgi:Mechanosensitive ion channel, conserved TM helix